MYVCMYIYILKGYMNVPYIPVLPTAVLIFYYTIGFIELFHSWPVAATESLSLTYGGQEDSCNNLVVICFGRLAETPMKILNFLGYGDDMKQNSR